MTPMAHRQHICRWKALNIVKKMAENFLASTQTLIGFLRFLVAQRLWIGVIPPQTCKHLVKHRFYHLLINILARQVWEHHHLGTNPHQNPKLWNLPTWTYVNLNVWTVLEWTGPKKTIARFREVTRSFAGFREFSAYCITQIAAPGFPITHLGNSPRGKEKCDSNNGTHVLSHLPHEHADTAYFPARGFCAISRAYLTKRFCKI